MEALPSSKSANINKLMNISSLAKYSCISSIAINYVSATIDITFISAELASIYCGAIASAAVSYKLVSHRLCDFSKAKLWAIERANRSIIKHKEKALNKAEQRLMRIIAISVYGLAPTELKV